MGARCAGILGLDVWGGRRLRLVGDWLSGLNRLRVRDNQGSKGSDAAWM
jgi:hypothetical protein